MSICWRHKKNIWNVHLDLAQRWFAELELNGRLQFLCATNQDYTNDASELRSSESAMPSFKLFFTVQLNLKWINKHRYSFYSPEEYTHQFSVFCLCIATSEMVRSVSIVCMVIVLSFVFIHQRQHRRRWHLWLLLGHMDDYISSQTFEIPRSHTQ